jgi:hypothetical protein
VKTKQILVFYLGKERFPSLHVPVDIEIFHIPGAGCKTLMLLCHLWFPPSSPFYKTFHICNFFEFINCVNKYRKCMRQTCLCTMYICTYVCVSGKILVFKTLLQYIYVLHSVRYSQLLYLSVFHDHIMHYFIILLC